MKPPRNILVPVDFSEASNRALAYAQTMAKALGASIRVLHVVPDPYAQGWSIEATGMNLGSLLDLVALGTVADG